MAYNSVYETRFQAVNMMGSGTNEAVGDVNRFKQAVDQANTSTKSAATSGGILKSQIDEINAAYGYGKGKVDDSSAAFYRFGRAIQMPIFGMQMMIFYVSMLQSSSDRLVGAENAVENAQERLNRVIKTGQRNTDEYRSAVRQLETAQAQLNSVQKTSTIMTGALALQGVSMVASFLSAVPELRKMTIALKEYNIVASIASALSGNWAKLAVGVGVAAVAVGGVMALQNSASSSGGQPITIEITNKDIIQDYLARTQGHNIKTLGAT